MRGEAAAHMIEGGRGGVIINISSIPRGQCRSDQLLRRESWRCRHDGDLGEETRAPPDAWPASRQDFAIREWRQRYRQK